MAASLAAGAEVVIIGGGAVGVCCASRLAERGHDVLLLERGDLCSGSSYGNAAFVPPSRSLPLAAPGVIAKTLRWMLDPHGPFRLRPRIDPRLAQWLLAFRRACTEAAAYHAARIIRDLTRESLALYEKLAEDGLEFGFRNEGLLELFRSPEGRAACEKETQLLRDLGIAADLIDNAELRRLLPQADDSVAGALFAREDAHINPPLFVEAVAASAKQHGARIETGTEVRGFVRDRNRIQALETSRGPVTASTVVLANGAWAVKSAHALGLRLLIEPAKGYSFKLEVGNEEQLDRPLLLSEIRTTVTPIGDALRVTSKLDLVGFDASIKGRRVLAIPRTIGDYIRLQPNYGVSDAWCGFRPLTPDGLPLIGRPRAYANLVLAVGGGRMGVALAPVTALLVSQLVGDNPKHPLLEHLQPDRFGPA